jgi:hypothetical protein
VLLEAAGGGAPGEGVVEGGPHEERQEDEEAALEAPLAVAELAAEAGLVGLGLRVHPF